MMTIDKSNNNNNNDQSNLSNPNIKDIQILIP